MQCPVCNVTLVMTERQGVEIDACPKCRGVWLDRGELDKIIERSDRHDFDDDDDDRNRRYPQQPYGGQGHYQKKKSFWSELFD